MIYKGRTTTLHTKDGITMYLDSDYTQLAEEKHLSHDNGDAGLFLFLGFIGFIVLLVFLNRM